MFRRALLAIADEMIKYLFLLRCRSLVCEGFRMTAARDHSAGTGAVVRKPPKNEPAMGERACSGLMRFSLIGVLLS
jgi:hypothetical protein